MSAPATSTFPGEAWKFQKFHAEHRDTETAITIELGLNLSLVSGRVMGTGEIIKETKEWISPELPPVTKVQKYHLTNLTGRWGKFPDSRVAFVSGQISGEPELPVRGDFEGLMCLAHNWRGTGDFRYLGETHAGVPVRPESGA